LSVGFFALPHSPATHTLTESVLTIDLRGFWWIETIFPPTPPTPRFARPVPLAPLWWHK
jgi:hypothetical protein